MTNTNKLDREQGDWFPACNGTETPFKTRGGHTLLYCWQPSSGRHAYINCETDMIMTDDDVRASLGTF
jgi:hypothetical protein